ncbi:site-specific DNA-methyltransferase [Helicobacter pylori]
MQNKEMDQEKSVNEKNLEVFNRYFPGCLSIENDNQLTLDTGKLKALLGDFSEIKEEGYGLDFVGKKIALNQAFKKNNKILKPLNESTSKHILIKGDNLDALKILKQSYSEKIKMIYIDPPYNTKNDNFIYSDDFSQSNEEVLKTLDYSKEKLDYIKNLFGSKCHSGWLSFMYPRLLLAKDLLKQDGVIFISIDDNECANLKILCDEIFGEDNFVNTIIWEKKYSPQNHTKWFSDNHDFILLYAKDKEIWRPILLPRTSEMNARYKNLDNDERGVWKSSDLSVGSAVERNIYPIFNPYTKQEIYPPHGRSWVYSQEKLQELIADNRIFFPTSGNGVPRYKRFLNEVKQGTTPLTIWKYTEVGHTQDAKREIKEIFDGQALFETPKPKALLKRILEISTQENDIILDFFAGSGTTAHAVLESNKSDYQKLSEGGGYLMA